MANHEKNKSNNILPENFDREKVVERNRDIINTRNNSDSHERQPNGRLLSNEELDIIDANAYKIRSGLPELERARQAAEAEPGTDNITTSQEVEPSNPDQVDIDSGYVGPVDSSQEVVLYGGNTDNQSTGDSVDASDTISEASKSSEPEQGDVDPGYVGPVDPNKEITPFVPESRLESGASTQSELLPAPDQPNRPELPPAPERSRNRHEALLEVPDINPAIQEIAEKYVKARRLDSIGDDRLNELQNDAEFQQIMEQYRYVIGHNYMHEHPDASIEEVEAFLTCEQIRQENDIKNTVIDRWDNGSVFRRFVNWKSKHPVLATVAIGGAVAVAGVATGGFGLAGIASASVGGAIGVGAAKGGLFGLLGSRQNSTKSSIRDAWGDDNNPEGHTADERRHGQYMALAEALVNGVNDDELMGLITETVNRDAYIIRESAYRDRTKNRSKTAGGIATGAIIGGAVAGIAHGLTNMQHEVASGSTQTEPTYTTEYVIENNSAPINIDDMRVDYYQNSAGYTGANTEETLINNIRNLGLDGVSEDHVRDLFSDAVSRLPGDIHSGGNIANSVGTLSSPGNEAARWVIDDVMQRLSSEGAFGTHEVSKQVLNQAAEQVASSLMENVLDENARNAANIAADTIIAAATFVVGDRISKGGTADHPTAVGGPIGRPSNSRRSGGRPTPSQNPTPDTETALANSPETSIEQGDRGASVFEAPTEGVREDESEAENPDTEQDRERVDAVVRQVEQNLTQRYNSGERRSVLDIMRPDREGSDLMRFEGNRITGQSIGLTDAARQRIGNLLRQNIDDFTNDDNLRRLFDTEQPAEEA